jgi:hypothetical protein
VLGDSIAAPALAAETSGFMLKARPIRIGRVTLYKKGRPRETSRDEVTN